MNSGKESREEWSRVGKILAIKQYIFLKVLDNVKIYSTMWGCGEALIQQVWLLSPRHFDGNWNHD